MNTAVLFSASTDRWATPSEGKDALYAEFALNFDPCPLDGTVNGLAPLFCRWAGKRVFCNPPYGPGIAMGSKELDDRGSARRNNCHALFPPKNSGLETPHSSAGRKAPLALQTLTMCSIINTW